MLKVIRIFHKWKTYMFSVYVSFFEESLKRSSLSPCGSLWNHESLLKRLVKPAVLGNRCIQSPVFYRDRTLVPSVQILDLNNGCLCSLKLLSRDSVKQPLKASANITPKTSEKPKYRTWTAWELVTSYEHLGDAKSQCLGWCFSNSHLQVVLYWCNPIDNHWLIT